MTFHKHHYQWMSFYFLNKSNLPNKKISNHNNKLRKIWNPTLIMRHRTTNNKIFHKVIMRQRWVVGSKTFKYKNRLLTYSRDWVNFHWLNKRKSKTYQSLPIYNKIWPKLIKRNFLIKSLNLTKMIFNM